MRDNLIPIFFFLFMVINIYLDKTKRKKRRQEHEQEKQQNEQEREPEIIMGHAPQQAEKPNDLAAEFERRLKKTTEAAKAAKAKERAKVVTDGGRIHHDDEAIVHDNQGRVRYDGKVAHDSQPVHRDGEAAHDNSGRIHRDNESLKHDKSKVYYDPRGDYSYDEEKMNAAAAAFNARYAKEQEPVRKPRVKLKHAALVNGFIISQVLDKPRALKPYDDCQ